MGSGPAPGRPIEGVVETTALAVSLLSFACALAYWDELRTLTGRTRAPSPTPARPPAPALKAVPVAGPASMLETLARDLESPDPRKVSRALDGLANYPPGELSRHLIPLLDGPVDDTRDRIADLLLRHGGEDVLEPLHRYFLGRDESFEGRAAADARPRVRTGPATVTSLTERLATRLGPPEDLQPLPSKPADVIFLDPAGGRPRVVPGLAAGTVPFDAGVLELEPELRARAMADLPATGHPHAADLLTKVVRADPEAMVRAAAAAALADLPPVPGQREALEGAARDPDGSVRWNACYALGRLGDRRAKACLRRAENDADGAVRLAARKALEALGLDPPMPASVDG